MGFLVSSLPLLPPNQLVLLGSAFDLKAEGCPFSVQGGFCWHHGHSCHTLPPGAELAQAIWALGGPGSAPHRLHPKASPFTLWGQKALITTPVLLLPLLQLIQTGIVWGNTKPGQKKHPPCLLSRDWSETDNDRARPPVPGDFLWLLHGPATPDHSLLTLLPALSLLPRSSPPLPRHKLALTPHIPETHKSSWVAEPPPPPRSLCTSSQRPTPTHRPEPVGLPLFLKVTPFFRRMKSSRVEVNDTRTSRRGGVVPGELCLRPSSPCAGAPHTKEVVIPLAF